MKFSSINEMFRWRVEQSGASVALMHKTGGRWIEISWNRYYESVRFVSQGIRALGVEKGDRVAIFCNTRVEWVLCDMATLGCGGVVVPIYHSSPTKDVEYIVNHSGVKVIIVENSKLLDKVLEVREKLGDLTKIVMLEGPPPEGDDDVILMSELVELGRQQKSGLYEKMAAEVGLNDIATIVYTSTGGLQKGVVHEHAQLLAEQYAIQKVIPANQDELTLLFLPLSHIFGRVIEYWNLHAGVKIAFVESYDRLVQNMREINPHFLAVVPRVLEKIFSTIARDVDSQGKAKKATQNWCISVGEEVVNLSQAHKPIPMVLNTKLQVAKRLMFDDVREQFGNRIKFIVCSGAPLHKDIGTFFQATGLPILEAYGLTETAGAATINTLGNSKIGSVGKPLPGVEIKLDMDGEILIKGDTVMREYWEDPKDTESVMQDGWLKSGDIGELDGGGFLTITDRKKNLIITSGGKNISPLNIEKHLRSDPYIDQVFVHGDSRNFITALITLTKENIERWAQENNVPSNDFTALCKHHTVIKFMEDRIHFKNKDLAGPETIKKFCILDQTFSVEGGELTSTLKLNRKLINQKYKDILDEFYN